MERIFHAVHSFRARPLFSRARGPEGNYRLRNVYKSRTCGGGNFGRSCALCAQPHFNCPVSAPFLFFFPCVVREWHGQSFVSSRTPRNMIIQLALQKIFLNTTKQNTRLEILKYLIYILICILRITYWYFDILIGNKSISDSLKMILMFQV